MASEQKSHAEQARETLDFAETLTPESPVRELLTALVQCQLAIQETLKEIREEIAAAKEAVRRG